MKSTITILGLDQQHHLTEITSCIHHTQCELLELRGTGLSHTLGLVMIVEGHWNQLAKLEVAMDTLARKLGFSVSYLRHAEPTTDTLLGLPYLLEVFSGNDKPVIPELTVFLLERGIVIEEINASRHLAAYFNHPIFAVKMVVLLPANMRILSLREEFLDVCDDLGIDGILEPIKR